MHRNKSHYSLAEAAEIAKCKPMDFLHDAIQRKIILHVGVPDRVDVRVYDELSKSIIPAFLITPQLLSLGQLYCLKIELNGRTEQSDFSEGHLIESSGNPRKIMPDYGYPHLRNRDWVYWRTFNGDLVYLMELTAEKLFVLRTDLEKLIKPTEKPEDPVKDVPRRRKSKTSESIKPDTQANQSVAVDENTATTHAPSGSNQPEVLQDVRKRNHPTASSKTTSPKLLRINEVRDRVGGKSRSWVYDKMNPKSPRYDATFPVQKSLGHNSVGWLESEINAWIESRKNSHR